MPLSLLRRGVCLLAAVAGGIHLPAQSIVDQLAREICNCLEAGPLIYPRVQADRCLETVLDAHPRQIRSELQLSVRNADDRRRLEDLLVDPLTSDCAVIRELPEAAPPTAPRYSDLLLMQAPPQIADKRPVADAARKTVRESGDVRSVVARLVDVVDTEWVIETRDGQTMHLRIEPAQSTSNRPPRDAYRRFTYQLDWHSAPLRVVRRLTGVKSIN